MKRLILTALAALVLSVPAHASGDVWWKCVTGTEPAQWDIDGTCPNTRSRDISSVVGSVSPVGSPHGISDWNYGGYHYHDNGNSNFTVTGAAGTYTYQYSPSGSFTVTH